MELHGGGRGGSVRNVFMAFVKFEEPLENEEGLLQRLLDRQEGFQGTMV